MEQENTDPNSLEFWKNRISDRTILLALRNFPEAARRIFGAVPVMRADVLQLGMILGARQILAEPPGKMSFEGATTLEEELSAAMGELSPADRLKCEVALTHEAYEEDSRELAKIIIRQATGEEL